MLDYVSLSAVARVVRDKPGVTLEPLVAAQLD